MKHDRVSVRRTAMRFHVYLMLVAPACCCVRLSLIIGWEADRVSEWSDGLRPKLYPAMNSARQPDIVEINTLHAVIVNA